MIPQFKVLSKYQDLLHSSPAATRKIHNVQVCSTYRTFKTEGSYFVSPPKIKISPLLTYPGISQQEVDDHIIPMLMEAERQGVRSRDKAADVRIEDGVRR